MLGNVAAAINGGMASKAEVADLSEAARGVATEEEALARLVRRTFPSSSCLCRPRFCLPIHPSVCPSACLSIRCLPACLPACQTCLSVGLSARLSIRLLFLFLFLFRSSLLIACPGCIFERHLPAPYIASLWVHVV